MSGRDCNFASTVPSKYIFSLTASSQHGSSSSDEASSQSMIIDSRTSPVTLDASSNFQPPPNRGSSDVDSPTIGTAVNPEHIELVMHLMLDKEILNLSHTMGDYSSEISHGLQIALKFPYLLHQMLAFSARHLAFLHPDRYSLYLRQAVSLQTRALSMFNVACTDVDQSNCVPILLFSVILGHHLLADLLAESDTSSAEVQRGIYTIAHTTWPLLMETELQPVLSLSSAFTSRTPMGSHCQEAAKIIESTTDLTADQKDACRLAINYLQVGFDAILTENEEPGNRYQMIFSWTFLAPPEFTRLLATKRPEALIVLSYYALLLHYGRAMWQVGDSGKYIFGMISDYLGPRWEDCLDYPRAIIAK
ncbi:hypothetical protein ACMFMF_007533 [Clarireedia jacksonii]